MTDRVLKIYEARNPKHLVASFPKDFRGLTRPCCETIIVLRVHISMHMWAVLQPLISKQPSLIFSASSKTFAMSAVLLSCGVPGWESFFFCKTGLANSLMFAYDFPEMVLSQRHICPETAICKLSFPTKQTGKPTGQGTLVRGYHNYL